MELHTVTVTVAGKGYQLSGTQQPEHFHHLGQLVNRRVNETAQANPSLGGEGCAVAAALSLADELVTARQELSRLRAQLADLIQDGHEA